jgi:hypothetical protein
MIDNIKAGSDIHAGDGGYSIGTKEEYDEFVKGRNQSLGKARMNKAFDKAFNDLLYQSGLIADGCWEELDTYTQEAIERLFQMTVLKCADKAHELIKSDGDEFPLQAVSYRIKQHFGVEE